VQVFLFYLQGVGCEEHHQAQFVLKDTEQATPVILLVPRQVALTELAMVTAMLPTNDDQAMM
jgi:hypothetical protein